ncbi:unnamed protein product [Caenorhabditis auriculariae]|uniref:Uncharacterized protein n=1 Tax=Caenorhabditis auriculariae TaxID=2777116 RepID=A0A8S1H2D7_9PELO|nr:unnamed protein product [Caenorhabditis auriculariae]
MCLCGLLSISHSVNLVICIEVFFALVLLIQSPDLLTMNGTYFYFLGMFDGGGIFFFTLHVTGACEVWWCLLTVEYYRHMCTQKLQPPWSIDPIVFTGLFFAKKSFLGGPFTVLFNRSELQKKPILILIRPRHDYHASDSVPRHSLRIFRRREFFCPWFFPPPSKMNENSRRAAEKLLQLKLQYVIQARLLASVCEAPPPDSLNHVGDLDRFIPIFHFFGQQMRFFLVFFIVTLFISFTNAQRVFDLLDEKVNTMQGAGQPYHRKMYMNAFRGPSSLLDILRRDY